MAVAQSLDHFVVPVDDLVVAEEFYVRVFGGRVTRRNGLNVRQRKRGAVPHTFIQIGGKRMGVYLQSEERPQPAAGQPATVLNDSLTLNLTKDTYAQALKSGLRFGKDLDLASAAVRRWARALGATPVGTGLSPPAVSSAVSGTRASRDAHRHHRVGQDDNACPLDGCRSDGWLVRAGR